MPDCRPIPLNSRLPPRRPRKSTPVALQHDHRPNEVSAGQVRGHWPRRGLSRRDGEKPEAFAPVSDQRCDQDAGASSERGLSASLEREPKRQRPPSQGFANQYKGRA